MKRLLIFGYYVDVSIFWRLRVLLGDIGWMHRRGDTFAFRMRYVWAFIRDNGLKVFNPLSVYIDKQCDWEEGKDVEPCLCHARKGIK